MFLGLLALDFCAIRSAQGGSDYRPIPSSRVLPPSTLKVVAAAELAGADEVGLLLLLDRLSASSTSLSSLTLAATKGACRPGVKQGRQAVGMVSGWFRSPSDGGGGRARSRAGRLTGAGKDGGGGGGGRRRG